MKVEAILWVDSGFHISDGWKPVVDAMAGFNFDDMKVISAGLVVYEDDDVVVLTTSYSATTESAYGMQIIAKSNITNREVLRATSE